MSASDNWTFEECELRWRTMNEKEFIKRAGSIAGLAYILGTDIENLIHLVRMLKLQILLLESKSASDRFFDKLDIAAGLEGVKSIPGDQPTDAEVDQAVAEVKGELKELGQKCGFELDETTLKDWIASRKPD